MNERPQILKSSSQTACHLVLAVPVSSLVPSVRIGPQKGQQATIPPHRSNTQANPIQMVTQTTAATTTVAAKAEAFTLRERWVDKWAHPNLKRRRERACFPEQRHNVTSYSSSSHGIGAYHSLELESFDLDPCLGSSRKHNVSSCWCVH